MSGEPAGAAPLLIDELLHPRGAQYGVMAVDADRCTSCGLCVLNCPYDCWEMDEGDVPRMKDACLCFSCGNCMVACSRGAVSMVRPYSVQGGGYFDADYPPYRLPRDPYDAEGSPAEWTETERIIMERRSVRHYKSNPVPETMIRRVIEAGRFAPSGGNHQPWKFAVITDPVFLAELEERAHALWSGDYQALENEDIARSLVGVIDDAVWDPRVREGLRMTALKRLPVFLGAPVAIFIGAHKKMSEPKLQTGICGQNMNLAALAVGLGFVWSNFGAKAVERIPEIKAKLGFSADWTVAGAAVMGYPKFRQKGIVPRQDRPVVWFRPGGEGSEID